MDQDKETIYTAIDIYDSNEKYHSYDKEGDNYYTDPSYLRGGKLKSFYKDDIQIVACGHSNNYEYFVDEVSETLTIPIISMFRGELLN